MHGVRIDAYCIGIVSNESGGSNESGTGDNRAATSVHRACRDSARRWRRHRLRQGALALLEPGFAFCILHAAERRHSASRYPRAPGVSPTQSWGQRDRVDAQPVLIAPERARPASEAAQPVPSPRPTVGGIIGGGSAALAAIIALGYMGLVQAEEMAEATVVVLLTVSHAHLTHRSFSVSHQRLSFHPHAYTRAGQRPIPSPPRRKRTAPPCACHPSVA